MHASSLSFPDCKILRLITLRTLEKRLGYFVLAVVLSVNLPAETNSLIIGHSPEQQAAELTTGDQLLIENYTGTLTFAGRDVALDQFNGILGIATEVAYVTTFAGSAQIDGEEAKPGKILMIPPLGNEVAVQRFDARRLLDTWTDTLQTQAPESYEALDTVAKNQSHGIFFGRLGRTSFNVAASGSVKHELARRTVVGEAIVRELRFATYADREALNRAIIQAFLDSLRRGDVDAVAALMDPVPFGITDLRSGGAEARQMLARSLVEQRDWSQVIPETPSLEWVEGNEWLVGSKYAVTIRPLGDFSYIRTIQLNN